MILTALKNSGLCFLPSQVVQTPTWNFEPEMAKIAKIVGFYDLKCDLTQSHLRSRDRTILLITLHFIARVTKL